MPTEQPVCICKQLYEESLSAKAEQKTTLLRTCPKHQPGTPEYDQLMAAMRGEGVTPIPITVIKDSEQVGYMTATIAAGLTHHAAWLDSLRLDDLITECTRTLENKGLLHTQEGIAILDLLRSARNYKNSASEVIKLFPDETPP